MSTVVVGLDGSPGAQGALDLALQQARLRAATLRAVYASEPAALPAYVVGRAGGHAGPSAQQQQEAGEQLLDEALQAAGGDVPVERQVLVGKNPAAALIEASKDADLLVVGSRGLGGFEGLVLGSVSQQCAAHAHCPVIVVPGSQATIGSR